MRSKLICVLVLFLGPRLAWAAPNEPRGFGKVRLGMTVEEVKKVVPEMKPVGNPTPETAALLAVYHLESQSIFGLKPCLVTLNFDPTRLYQIAFDCGHGLKVLAALEKHLGKPSQGVPNQVLWQHKRTIISLDTRSRTFSFADRTLSQAFNTRMLRYVIDHQPKPGQVPGAEAPTPAPTAQ